LPRKPKRRKQSGRGSRYIIAIILIVALAAVGLYWYAYLRAPSAGSGSASPIYATVNTSKGSFEIELFSSAAPKTVANFVSLSKSGFYDNLVWHRIVDTPNPFVIQTGDPLTRNGGGDRSLWGTGGSNTSVPLEIDPSLHNDVGYLAMAHTAASTSATSQFYINLANNTNLDGSYTVFGKVISGMNVVDAIAATPVYTSGSYLDQPIAPVYVTSITILNSGP
jgi:cyclophilin family peptidyl-prolyl cis-trans isomerase